jgi:hypothetical protein
MRANAGRATGGTVYGYDSKGQVIEAEAAIMREIFERTANGDPMRVITNDLNARGVPSPGAKWNRTERRHDGCWLISVLNAMLQNERYMGRVVWNRSAWVKDPDTGKRVRRDRPQSEWTVTECPALVNPDIWDKVQRRMQERATGERRGHVCVGTCFPVCSSASAAEPGSLPLARTGRTISVARTRRAAGTLPAR